MAWAAVLGVTAGVCAGYIIQADRPPTPLPPLSQPGLVYPMKPAAADKVREPLTAAQDHHVRTDGDLRKLLLKKPRNARNLPVPGSSDGWLSLVGFAEDFEEPGAVFEDLAGDIRRTATVAWVDQSDLAVYVQLVQFRDETSAQSADYLSEQQLWTHDDLAPTDSEKHIPGSGNGELYVYAQPEPDPGYLPYYTAQALARRGDVVMEIIWVSAKPVSEKQAMSVAERQWERL